MKALIITIAILTLGSMTIVIDSASAHSGGTNANGCHTNHATGDYHCHTPKSSGVRTPTYCHVINGESRCGYAFLTCNRLVLKFGGYCKRD